MVPWAPPGSLSTESKVLSTAIRVVWQSKTKQTNIFLKFIFEKRTWERNRKHGQIYLSFMSPSFEAFIFGKKYSNWADSWCGQENHVQPSSFSANSKIPALSPVIMPICCQFLFIGSLSHGHIIIFIFISNTGLSFEGKKSLQSTSLSPRFLRLFFNCEREQGRWYCY